MIVVYHFKILRVQCQCNEPSLPQFPWGDGWLQGYRHANQGFQRIEEQLCSQFEMQTEVGAVHFVVELVEMPALAVFPLSRVGRRKSYAPGITTECLQQFMGLGKARPGNAWPYVFSHADHHSQWIYSKLRQVPANISQWICKACKAFTCTSLQSSYVYWFIVERMGQGGGEAIQICSNLEGDRI